MSEPEIAQAETIEFVRVFITDGTYADARLPPAGNAWEAFIHQIVTNGCVITNDTFVNRSSIVKMLRMRAVGVPETMGNLIAFPETKGSA